MITPGGRILQDIDEYLVPGQLGPWEEAVGKFVDICKVGSELELVMFVPSLDCEVMFSFPADSLEARTLSESLSNDMFDRSIAILRTDLRDRPIVVRVMEA